MATLTVVTSTVAGQDLTFSAVNTSDEFANDGDTVLLVKNAAAVDCDVTISTASSAVTIPGYGQATFSNVVFTTNAGDTSIMGPFPVVAYNNANGRVTVGYESTSSITAVAVQVNKAP